MQTELDNPSAAWAVRGKARRSMLARVLDLRLALLLALALLAGALAYQAPPSAQVWVGWLGDQLFLQSSEGQAAADAGRWYGDELTDDTASGRSRWTRQDATVTLPGLAARGAGVLTLRVQGWPSELGQQPAVTVTANGVAAGTFTPTPAWADYMLAVPAAAQSGGGVQLELHTSAVFTSTQSHADDLRPKGVRVASIALQGNAPVGFAMPELLPLLWLALDGVLLLGALLLLTRRATLAFVVAVLLVSGGALGLALARAWTVALMPWLAALLVALLLVVSSGMLARGWSMLLARYTRGQSLGYGLAAAALAWMLYVVARAALAVQLPPIASLRNTFPDVLLYVLIAASLLLLLLVYGRAGLPRAAQVVVNWLASPRGGALALALFLALWLGYAAWAVAVLPWVGHADYADNAVVARNLVHGRGWVVEYVTQFYQLYPDITHPQETWPLLQPVWIAASFALFGVSNWAAKVPNLVFITLLALLIFHAGTRLWDQRVGLVAAIVVLTSQYFFRLVIFTTTDLAFTLFAFGAAYFLHCAFVPRRTTKRRIFILSSNHLVITSGILTGLMLLQKPGSGALIALGMGLWMLWQTIRGSRLFIRHPRGVSLRVLAPVALWAVIALAILSPYLARNVQLFGKPFASTESYDAWVLGYGDWEDIYKVYTPEAGLSETGGLPERSWLLRWGFDRALAKIDTQVSAVRDYLLPPWRHLPLNLSDTLSGRKSLLMPVGAWLALAGALAALRTRRRLLGLLAAAFVPYTLFLVLYWHANEERYFVVLMPWLALLAADALWRGYDHIARVGSGRWAALGLALVIAALVAVAQPAWPDMADKIENEPRLLAADLDAYAWLAENTPPGTVVMTRTPWQFAWAADRPALMVPNTASRETFLRLAKHYNAQYLVRDVFQNPSTQTQQLIEKLAADPQGGLQEVYVTPVYQARNDKGELIDLQTEVYRFSANYDNVAALQP